MFWQTTKSLKRFAPFVFASVVTSLAIVLDRVINPELHNSLVLFLYPAAFFSVWFAGTSAGLFSVFLGTVAGYLNIVYPPGGEFHQPQLSCLIDLGIYTVFGMIFGFLISNEKNIRKRTQEAYSELRNTTRKLTEREKELSSAVRARDDFFSIASHELKTPITALKLQVQLFKRELQRQVDSKLKDHFVDTAKDMENQISRLTSLVDSLLDVTRIAQGSFKLELAQVDIAELIKEVAVRYSNILSTSGCKVNIRQKGSAVLKCDRMRMEQVFTNLFANSAKYAPQSAIEIGISREDELLQIEFTDSGFGMSPIHLKQIFTPFRRLDASSRGVPGLGLGLFIVKQIVEAHSGQIECKSELGKGSSFQIALPTSGVSAIPYSSFSFDSTSDESLNFLHRRFATSFAD
jgi:signal transduction histidine kinase